MLREKNVKCYERHEKVIFLCGKNRTKGKLMKSADDDC